jgi:hypothetical protein
MAPGGKDRVPSPILSISTVATTAANGGTVIILKAPASEVFKPEPFAGFK